MSLPLQDRVREVPYEQRVGHVTGEKAVRIGDEVREERDWVRARALVIGHQQPIHGLLPARGGAGGWRSCRRAR